MGISSKYLIFPIILYLLLVPMVFSQPNCDPTETYRYNGKITKTSDQLLQIPNSDIKIGLVEYNNCGRGEIIIFEGEYQRNEYIDWMIAGSDLNIFNDYQVIPLDLAFYGFKVRIVKNGVTLVDGDFIDVINIEELTYEPTTTTIPVVSTPPPTKPPTTCRILAPPEMESLFVQVRGFSKSTQLSKITDVDRFFTGSSLITTSLIKHSTRTYEAQNFKVDVSISNYEYDYIPELDVLEYPTQVTNDWEEPTLNDHLSYQKVRKSPTSENIEYLADIRVVTNCFVVRGLWQDNRRKNYDVGPNLDEGKENVIEVLSSIVEKIDQDYEEKIKTSTTTAPPKTPPKEIQRTTTTVAPTTTTTKSTTSTTSTTMFVETPTPDYFTLDIKKNTIILGLIILVLIFVWIYLK